MGQSTVFRTAVIVAKINLWWLRTATGGVKETATDGANGTATGRANGLAPWSRVGRIQT